MAAFYYAQSLPNSDFNAALNKYFVDCVQLRMKETKSIKDFVVPEVEEILKEIHNLDPLHMFGDKPIRVGSSHSGLKVGRADEFDFSVPLLNISGLEWAPGSPFFYSLISRDGSPKNDDTNFDQSLKIVPTYNQLPSPGLGYCQIALSGFPAYQYQSLMIENRLIPYRVKRHFKQLYLKAVDKLDTDATRAIVHGPALTIRFTVKINSKSFPVSVDFTPIVQARLPFQYQGQITWPRYGTTWPSDEKVEAIWKIGVSLVAKKNMHWYYSFAECEKELVREIDRENEQGVRGQRKKVHRIMKRFFETTWSDHKPEECVLTSYMIKNTWFWECERYPGNEQWQEAYLTTRFDSCVERLIEFIQRGNLPLYFHDKINLLKGQDFSEVVKRMRTWRGELISKYMCLNQTVRIIR